MNTSVINETDYPIPVKKYRVFLKATLEVAQVRGDVTLVFIDNVEMKRLNLEYRGKDRPTDVLTFLSDEPLGGGDIAISYQWVLEHYIESKQRKNIYMLIIHSVLHLTGVHHSYTRSSLLKNRCEMRLLYSLVCKHLIDKRNKKMALINL